MSIAKGSISRRSFLSGLLATASLPAWAQTIPANPDVVGIGAGSAGLSAARSLIARGKSIVVIEGADRIGGRAYTESNTFGIPFDHGCSWIMGNRDVVYANKASEWNYDLLKHAGASEAFYVGGHRATSTDNSMYNKAWNQVERSMYAAGSKGRDVSAKSVIPGDMDYAGVAQTWIGPMDWGVDFKNLSTMDVYNYGTIHTNYMVRQGYGTVVARMGADIRVQLNTPATRINWGGDGVLVETPAGSIRARAYYFLTWPFGYNIMVGFVGGEFGWQLSDEGSSAAINFALDEVVKMVGSSARDHFVKGHLTGWANNPWTRGAFAAARPGHHCARAELARPVDNRLVKRSQHLTTSFVAGLIPAVKKRREKSLPRSANFVSMSLYGE